MLTVDWNKYRPLVLASGGTDKAVRVWDCRMLKTGGAPAPGIGQGQGGNEASTMVGAPCEMELLGHEYAVRKVEWSPHRADILASASYDMTCRMYVSLPPFSYSHSPPRTWKSDFRFVIDGRQIHHLDVHRFCISKTHTRNSSLAAAGHCTMKAS